MTVGERGQEYAEHLAFVCEEFNSVFIRHGLGVKLSQPRPEHCKNAKVAFENRRQEDGVMHRSQIASSAAIMKQLLTSNLPGGVAIGSMQSGKTSTATACMFLTPISLLVNRPAMQPLFLTTSSTSNEEQFKKECAAFLSYYGHLNLKSDNGKRLSILSAWAQLAETGRSKSGNSFLTFKNALVFRRVRGGTINHIARTCHSLLARNIRPVLFLDESQYGASDRLIKNEDGKIKQVPCVLRRILDEVDVASGNDHSVPFVCLSATPFESGTLPELWQLGQSLDNDYQGVNAFAGQPIDPTSNVAAPKITTLNDLAECTTGSTIVEFDPQVFHALRGNGKDWRVQRKKMSRWLAEVLLELTKVENVGRSGGICLRAINNNTETDALLDLMALSPAKVEVIKFYGPTARARTIKQLLENRRNPDLPFLILVTNRARMSDSFPSEVHAFIEFSKKASDINALLQGIFGRACGYNKKSTVYVSGHNKRLIEEYVDNVGVVKYAPSRHAQPDFREDVPARSQVFEKFSHTTAKDVPKVAEFLRRIQDELVDTLALSAGDTLFRSFPANATKRTAKILQIGFETGCLVQRHYSDSVRQHHLPITKFALRWSDAGQARAGAKPRTHNERQLEPDHVQISLKKVDESTGLEIWDQHATKKEIGRWVVTQIAVPHTLLAQNALERVSCTSENRKIRFLPVPHSPFFKFIGQQD